MAVALNPRAERLLARLPRLTVYSALELLLLVLLAVQSARLFWALVTPLGPVGEWKDLDALRAAAAPPTTSLATFDPFFRQAPGQPAAGAAPAVVTTLNLRLTGVREDRATGRGTAFVTLANGTQQAFVVGEEIEPGVVLSAVGFDNITITRGGAREQLFLDQSPAGAAPSGQPGQAPPQPGFSPPPVQQQPVVVTPVPPPPPPPPAPTGNQAQPVRVNQ